MWWKLGVLAAVTAALLFVLFAPIFTMTVKVDLPPAAHSVSASQVSIGRVQPFAEGALWFAEVAVVTGILGAAGWIARGIVRRHRTSN